jgi:hypothetical protein
MWTAGVWNDQQIPYHDPRAFSVAVQVFADAKLDLLIYNGDWGDYMALATHPKGWRTDEIRSWKEEISQQRELLETSQRAIKPKKSKWNDGNHEWRVQRAFERDPKLARTVLDLDFAKQEISSVKEAISVPVLFNFQRWNIKYSGMYPKGCWLKDGLEAEKNIYVHHGYTARKKSGFTISGQMDDHWTSQIVGHCERLAGPIWTRKMGRDFLGIENGNLSKIGEPDLGDDIYAGVPHSSPMLMNHRQGISILYFECGEWWPFTIKIRDGKAVGPSGKLYKA